MMLKKDLTALTVKSGLNYFSVAPCPALTKSFWMTKEMIKAIKSIKMKVIKVTVYVPSNSWVKESKTGPTIPATPQAVRM